MLKYFFFFPNAGGPWTHVVVQISAAAVWSCFPPSSAGRDQYACIDQRSVLECTVANQTVVTQQRPATSRRKPQIGVLLTFGQVLRGNYQLYTARSNLTVAITVGRRFFFPM